ncbi:GNAT family N-acetyltransferase [Sphingomonas hengshuiensis]|uniref:GCN5 family acetyltransferase n=1 Tax=Sphingomonas hengshuiensis TaxID=1609977 RepID=A0A7U4LEI5_9SPHN|nr:GNAT family N-acetyltransferase [Sphingomonas hengshuiensis]AJP71529.1 GCN5 family acetyltransferase [Sphingomonas hengshuiensis]
MIAIDRLLLRRWEDRDRAPFHAMCVDPEVMAHLGPPLSRAESDAAIDRQNGLYDSIGHCFWAVERRDDGAFLGFCGLKPGAEATPIEGEIEIGWRLARAHWGRGYAREAAQASLAWGWANLDVPRIAAITTPGNTRSWGLMERIGMVRAPHDDFDHPAAIAALRAHITYRIARPASSG